MTSPRLMPDTTTEVIAQLDQAIEEAVEARRSSGLRSASAADGCSPRPLPLPDLAVAIDRLAAYAGDAIAGPLRGPAADAVELVEHLTGRAERSEADVDSLVRTAGALDTRAHRAESFLPTARDELVNLGALLAEVTVERVRAEALATELEETLARIPEPRPGYPATKAPSHRQARALIREAHKRANAAAAELLNPPVIPAD